MVLKHILAAKRLADAPGVLARYGFIGRKVEYVPRIHASRRLQAEAQARIGLTRARGQAEPVDARFRVHARVAAAPGELSPQGIDGMPLRQSTYVCLSPCCELRPERCPRRVALTLRQRLPVHEAGRVRPVGVHKSTEKQALYKTAGKLALRRIGVKAPQRLVESLRFLRSLVEQLQGLGLRQHLGEKAPDALLVMLLSVI